MTVDFNFILSPAPRSEGPTASSKPVTVYGIIRDKLGVPACRSKGEIASATSTLMVWREEGGQLRDELLTVELAMPIDVASSVISAVPKKFGLHQPEWVWVESVPAFEVVKCEGRWGTPGYKLSAEDNNVTAYPHRLVMVTPPVSVTDTELDAIAAPLRDPVAISLPRIGDIQLQRAYPNHFGEFEMEGNRVGLFVGSDGVELCPTAMAFAKSCFGKFEAFLAGNVAAMTEYLHQIPADHWVRQTQAEITPAYFAENLRLTTVSFYSDESYIVDFTLNGAPHFWIEVNGDEKGEFEYFDFPD